MSRDPSGAEIAAIVNVRTMTTQRTGCPEWHQAGVKAAMRAADGTPGSILAAAALAAEDPSWRAPSEAAFRRHWPANATSSRPTSRFVPCPDHPSQDTTTCTDPSHRGDMACDHPEHADRIACPDLVAAAAAEVRAELAKRTKKGKP